MPPKKSALKKRKRQPVSPPSNEVSPTSSEQEILDAHPPGLRHRLKRPESVLPTYLIYVVVCTDRKRSPVVIIRKNYESQFEALAAFAQEYIMWTSGVLYPPRHTADQLTGAYLANMMEMSKRQVEGDNIFVTPLKGAISGKLEYDLLHRDDAELEAHDRKRRVCRVVCEQTTHEAAQ